MKKNNDYASGCLGLIIVLFFVGLFKIHSAISGFFEEREQEKLNGLYADYIDSIRPTLEPKLFTIQDLEQTNFYKKYKDSFNTPINDDTYENEVFAIDRGNETYAYLKFSGSRNYGFEIMDIDIMEKDFPHYYLESIEFKTKSVLADEDKQFVADLLTTIGYPTTVKDLKNVGIANYNSEGVQLQQSQYIEEIPDNACYQRDAFYSIWDRRLIDGEFENIYDLKQAFKFNCSFYPFSEVWNELEQIEYWNS